MRILTVSALAVVFALGGCATLGGNDPAAQERLLKAIQEIAQDPNCGHTDRLNITLGPVPGGSIFLERNCPTPAPKPAS